MESEVSAEARNGVLVVDAQGSRPARDVDAYDEACSRWYWVAQECTRHRVDRVLYRTKVRGRGSSSVTLRVFTDFGRFGISRNAQIAVLRAADRTKQVMELGVKVAQSEGWKIRLFDSEDDATAWLDAGDPT
jgi:hypothetical protein